MLYMLYFIGKCLQNITDLLGLFTFLKLLFGKIAIIKNIKNNIIICLYCYMTH